MRIIALLLLCTLTIKGFSQKTVLQGTVTDSLARPLAGVMVRIVNGNKVLGFTTTGRNGKYACTFQPSRTKNDTISFRKLNYEEHRQALPAGSKRLDATLQRSDYRLPEAVVKVPPVKTLGDTVLYHLKTFLQSGDHTLEEGLKRLPGINIDETGAISYMGRDISQFYIEGLNLLGGRYNLATKNIPAEKVTGVEVLRHHQANKVDKQELSNNVALNIRLSPKAQLKPFGTYEARLGYRPERLLYGAGGTGMLFRKEFQMLATLKLADDGRMGRNELFDHFGRSTWKTSAENALPLISGNLPPVRETRYLNSSDELFSLHTLQKLTADNQLKINASYSHRRSEHDYRATTIYPGTAGNFIVTDEQSDFLQKEHGADVGLDFRSDKEAQLLENQFLIRGRFADAESGVRNNETPYTSLQHAYTLGARNELTLVRRIKKWKIKLGSLTQYTETPDNTLDITPGTEAPATVRQQASSRTFHTQETFYTGFQLLPSLTLSLPATFTANANRLHTRWQGDTTAVNALQGWDMSLAVTPQIEYQTPSRHFRAIAGVPLTLFLQDYRNEARGMEQDFTRFHSAWSLALIYVPNGNVEWNASSHLYRNFGDMADLLTAPIQTDYRTLRTRSGIFGRSSLISNRLSFDWQEPLSFWHFTANANYNRTKSNVMGGQNVNDNSQSLLEAIRDNTGDAVSATASLSKYFLSIKTSVSADGSYYWQRNESLNRQETVTTYGSGYSVSGHLSAQPVTPLQVGYDLTFQKNLLRGNGSTSSSDTWRHQGHLTLTFSQGWLARVKNEWQRNRLPNGNRPTSTFFDAQLEYKFKKPQLRLCLELNNLLNARSYSYTTYSALNTYTYRHRLNGREYMLTVVLH